MNAKPAGPLIRAFVAVEVSEGARGQLSDLIASLRGVTRSRIRWVGPEQMHFTLAFLGEVPSDFVGPAKERLSEAAKDAGPFGVRMAGLGAFPVPSLARVVWAGVGEGKEEICRLQAVVVRGLSAIGFAPERRPFSPHLTLGRLKIPADVSGVCRAEFESERFTVDSVVLFQSVLKPTGPEYTRLGEWRLGSRRFPARVRS